MNLDQRAPLLGLGLNRGLAVYYGLICISLCLLGFFFAWIFLKPHAIKTSYQHIKSSKDAHQEQTDHKYHIQEVKLIKWHVQSARSEV